MARTVSARIYALKSAVCTEENLQKNDRIAFNQKIQSPNSKFNYEISNNLIPLLQLFPTIRVFAGAEFEMLTALSEQNFLEKRVYNFQNSDRMGFRLSGEPLYLLEQSRTSFVRRQFRHDSVFARRTNDRFDG